MELEAIIKDQNTLIVDVREPFEFARGHVGGAISIPLGGILTHVQEFQKSQHPVVLYCRSGMRSGQATAFLQAQGITDVYNGGGLEEMTFLRKAA